MFKIHFRLLVEAVQVVSFLFLMLYGYTLMGFTIPQAILVVSNVVFGMGAVFYFALNKKD